MEIHNVNNDPPNPTGPPPDIEQANKAKTDNDYLADKKLTKDERKSQYQYQQQTD